MDKKKKDLLIKLLSSFFTLLSVCLAIALLINLKFRQDYATVIVGMLGVCATLYAPVAAYFFYDSWKDQKNYDFKKSLIENIIENYSSIHYSVLMNARYGKAVSEIDKELIVFQNFEKVSPSKNYSNPHTLVYANISIYEKLTGDEEVRKLYRWFESCTMTLDTIHMEIFQIYKDYYERIDKSLFEDLAKDSIRHRVYKDSDEKNLFNYEIKQMKDLKEFKSQIKYHGNNLIEYEKNYHELIEMYEEKADELITLLIEKIKP